MDSLSYNLPMAPYGIVGRRGATSARIVIPSTSTPVIEGCQSVVVYLAETPHSAPHHARRWWHPRKNS